MYKKILICLKIIAGYRGLSNEAKRVLCKPYSAIGVRLVIFTAKEGISLTKNEITFGPISILFCTKSLLKAQK